jgi:hypothetical protein
LRYLHLHEGIFCRVRGLACYNDPESYAGGSVATGRVTLAGQVKGEHPDKGIYPGPPGWGLGVLLATAHCKKSIAAKIQQGYSGEMKDNEIRIKLATWNIRTLLQVGKMVEIAEELQKYKTYCNIRE